MNIRIPLVAVILLALILPATISAQEETSLNVDELTIAPGPLFLQRHSTFTPPDLARLVLIAPPVDGHVEFLLAGTFTGLDSIQIGGLDGFDGVRTERAFRPDDRPGLLHVPSLGGRPRAGTLLVSGFRDGMVSRESRVALTWLPPLEVEARSTVAEECPADVCLRPDEEITVELSGSGAPFLAVGKLARIENVNGDGDHGLLRATPEGTILKVRLNEYDENDTSNRPQVEWLVLHLPIDRSAYPLFRQDAQGSWAAYDTLTIQASSALLSPSPAPILRALAPDGRTEVNSVLAGTPTELLLTCASCEDLPLQSGRYRVVRRSAGPEGSTLANLVIHDIHLGGDGAPDTALALLEGIRETVIPFPRSVASLAVIGYKASSQKGQERAPVLEMAIRPQPTVLEVVTLRASGASTDRRVFPGETVRFRFRGPGMRWMDSVYLAGHPGVSTVLTWFEHRDDLVQAELSIPRTAQPSEDLVLTSQYGKILTVPLNIVPAQRPQNLSFVALHLGDSVVPLNAGVAGGGPTLVSRFDGAHFTMDDGVVDPGEGDLYGVQYLDVRVAVNTPDGERVAEHAACYAVRPPDEGRPVRYQVRPGCTLLEQPRLRLDPLLGGILGRAVPHATLDVEVRHQEAHYPGFSIQAFRHRFEREGWFTWDWNLQLPTALMVLGGGPDGEPQSATTGGETEPNGDVTEAGEIQFQATGLIYEWTPYVRQKRFPATLHAGLAVSTLFEREEENLSRLAVPVGVTIPIRNMTDRVNLQLYVGAMFPLVGKVFRDFYWVGYPGFGITVH